MKLSNMTEREFWNTFFTQDHIFEVIRGLVIHYPSTTSLEVDAIELGDLDSKFLNHLLLNPIHTLNAADEELTSIGQPFTSHPSLKLQIRLVNVPKDSIIHVEDIRGHHIGTFVAIPGIVTKITQVEPKVRIGAFRCVCGHVQRILQQNEILSEPFECPENEGGCTRKGDSTKFTLVFDQSIFIDSQKVEIQELRENVKVGTQLQRIRAYIYGDIVGRVNPGTEATFNGILLAQERRKGNVKSAIFEKVLLVNSLTAHNEKTEDVDLSDTDIEEIEALAKDPEIYSRFRKSVCPAICGMDLVKEILILQLFGGVTRRYKGTYLRGDIHILLIGDPGTAKSQLVRFIADIAPWSVFASGQSSTKAGLTATAVKDEFGEGRWTLEAGALVLADGGLACVDELDKMRPEDRSSMHEALEQQCITINKAGIKATFRTRCSLLAAANPKSGKFDTSGYKPLPEQFNMDAPLLSRFDVIVPIIDMPDRVLDLEIASHISNTHRKGKVCGNRSPPPVLEDEAEPQNTDIIPPELLKKYVIYARSTVFPVLTDDTAKYLETFYVNVRNSKDRADKDTPITPRQYEALIRLSEASARVRLSNTIDQHDVTRATTILRFQANGEYGAVRS